MASYTNNFGGSGFEEADHASRWGREHLAGMAGRCELRADWPSLPNHSVADLAAGLGADLVTKPR